MKLKYGLLIFLARQSNLTSSLKRISKSLQHHYKKLNPKYIVQYRKTACILLQIKCQYLSHDGEHRPVTHKYSFKSSSMLVVAVRIALVTNKHRYLVDFYCRKGLSVVKLKVSNVSLKSLLPTPSVSSPTGIDLGRLTQRVALFFWEYRTFFSSCRNASSFCLTIQIAAFFAIKAISFLVSDNL